MVLWWHMSQVRITSNSGLWLELLSNRDVLPIMVVELVENKSGNLMSYFISFGRTWLKMKQTQRKAEPRCRMSEAWFHYISSYIRLCLKCIILPTPDSLFSEANLNWASVPGNQEFWQIYGLWWTLLTLCLPQIE